MVNPFERETSDLYADADYIEDLYDAPPDKLPDVDGVSEPYDVDDLVKVLEVVAERAYEDGVIEDSVLELCAEYNADSEFPQVDSLNFLYSVGREVMMDNGDEIRVEDVEDYYESLQPTPLAEEVSSSGPTTQLMILALAAAEERDGSPVRVKDIAREHKAQYREKDETIMHSGLELEALSMHKIRRRISSLDLYGFATKVRSDPDHYELDMEIEDVLDSFEENEPRFDPLVEVVRERTGIQRSK